MNKKTLILIIVIFLMFIIGIILIVTGTTYSFYKIKLEGQKHILYQQM